MGKHHLTAIRCYLFSSQNPEVLKSTSVKPHFEFIFKVLAVSSCITLVFKLRTFCSGGIGNFGGGDLSGGGWSGWGGGRFWKYFFPAAIADEPQDQEWDSHGLPANIVVQLSRLSGFKKYKIFEILFLDRRRMETAGDEDSLFEMVSLRPGGVYTKAQLQKELETLAICGMFKEVDMEGKTNPDGSLGVTISLTESTWQSADKFRCINVGLMLQSKPIEMDADMTDKEKLEYCKSQEKDYKRRIETARPCLLPAPIHRGSADAEGSCLMARSTQGYCRRFAIGFRNGTATKAMQVVNFGDLNTEEVVCEVVEGDIIKMVIQFRH